MPVNESGSPFAEGVADRDGAVVVDADHVARPGLRHDLAIARHEGERVGELVFLAAAHVEGLHAGLETARADAHEGDAVAVLRIHVGLDLEHEAGELVLVRVDLARGGGARARRGRMLDEEIQQQLHAEVVDRRTEEHRRLLAGEDRRPCRTDARRPAPVPVRRAVRPASAHRCALRAAGIVERGEDRRILPGEVAARFEQMHFAS